jgi:hypothetical protein
MIWCVSSVWVHLAMFRYYMKLGAKRAELVQLIQKFYAINLHRIFWQRIHPIHPIGPQSHVLVCFIVFGALGNVLLLHETRCKNGLKWCN